MKIIERWRPVVGYSGWYSVSNMGRVKREKKHKNTFRGKILKPLLNRTGYLRATLSKKGKAKQYSIHRLVMRSFVGKCPEGMEVNHKDNDRKNNCLLNLKYDTHSANMKHCVISGRYTQSRKMKHKLNPQKVLLIRKMHSTNSFTQKELAKIFHVDPSNIGQVIRGVGWGWVTSASVAKKEDKQ